MGMFFQGGGGYQPTGREVWHMEQRRAEQQWKAADREQDQANKLIWGIHDQVRAIDAQGHKQVEAVAAEVTKMGAAEVKRILSVGITQYKGATHANPKGIVVWHWRAIPPDAVPIGVRRKDAGALMMLRHGGGIPRENHVWRAAARRDQTFLDDPEGKAWAKRSRDLITECEERYPILPRLRDDNWMMQFMGAAGMNRESTQQAPATTVYGEMPLPVRTVHVPELVGVEVQQDGLELVFAHREGSSVKDWVARHDKLTAMFKAQGVSAEHLAVSEDGDGSVRLRFNDAPSHFPPAVCIEPPSTVATSNADAIRRYEGAAWTLGVDARGKTIKFPVEEFPHVLVVGGTGAGKSVWARSIIEMFRTGYTDPDTGRDTAGGFTCFVSSGKVTDFVTLSKLPGVAMVAGDAAQTAAMVRTVRNEAERRYDEAAAAKLRGDNRAFDYPPIVLFLDEWGATWLAMDGAYKSAKSFETDIDWILRVGREARVHVVLLSQTIRKTGAGAVPGSWQANLGLTISLGKPEAETYNNPAVFPAGSRERAERVGNSIAGKRGRGMAVLEGNVTEFQSYYVWSPGTTSLDPNADKKVRPPTDEVRELWEQWAPISARVPWLSPRLGLEVSGPEWVGEREGDKKPELDSVASTPVVPLTDRAGNVKPGMERYDPWAPDWAGRVSSGGARRRAALSFDDEEPEAVSEPESDNPPKETEEPAAPTRLTPEQVRAEAIRLGLIPADDAAEGDADTGVVSEAEPAADAEAEPEVSAKPAAPTRTAKPKPETKPKPTRATKPKSETKPETKSDNSIGDF